MHANTDCTLVKPAFLGNVFPDCFQIAFGHEIFEVLSYSILDIRFCKPDRITLGADKRGRGEFLDVDFPDVFLVTVWTLHESISSHVARLSLGKNLYPFSGDVSAGYQPWPAKCAGSRFNE